MDLLPPAFEPQKSAAAAEVSRPGQDPHHVTVVVHEVGDRLFFGITQRYSFAARKGCVILTNIISRLARMPAKSNTQSLIL